MSVFDYIPHRRILNWSLGKESANLRAQIDDYKKRYEAAYKECNLELEKRKTQLDEEYEYAKNCFTDQLKRDADSLNALGDTVGQYVSLYFGKNVFELRLEMNSLQQDYVKENLDFISKKKNEIKIEIDLLKERKEILSRKSDISDIIELLSLSHYSDEVKDIKSAAELNRWINARLETIIDTDRIELYTLIRLKKIIEERDSFRNEIQFITWVIEQDVFLIKELNIYRSEQLQRLRELKEEAKAFKSSIEQIDKKMLLLAKIIRFYWAKDFIVVDAELSEKYNELILVKAKQKELREDTYADKNEKKEYNLKYTEITEDIGYLKDKRKRILKKRDDLFLLSENQNVPIRKLGDERRAKGDIFDDTRHYAYERIEELEKLEQQSLIEAEKSYQDEIAKLKVEKSKIIFDSGLKKASYEKKIKIISGELRAEEESLSFLIEKAVQSLKLDCLSKKNTHRIIVTKLDIAEKELLKLRESDKRFILAKAFTNTPEENSAINKIRQLNESKKQIEKEIIEIEKKIEQKSVGDDPLVSVQNNKVKVLKERKEATDTEFRKSITSDSERVSQIERRINTLTPEPTHPTFAEKKERKLIDAWTQKQKDFEEKRKEKNKR